MSPSKNQAPKKTSITASKPPVDTNEAEELLTEPLSPTKKVVDFDDDTVPVVGEKMDELEEFEVEDTTEDSDDSEASLDDEEIDPFGDKWEK